MGRPKKEYTDREAIESHNFWCIAYPDAENYDCKIVLERTASWFDEWYYIFHDRDIYTQLNYDKYKSLNHGEEPEWQIGDLKKKHYHIIGHMSHALTLGRASIDFGVPSNQVQKVGNLKEVVQYLTHRTDSAKTQYDTSEIISNVPDKVLKFMKISDCQDKAEALFNYINSSDCWCFNDLVDYSLKHQCWDELRRGQHLFTTLLKEKIRNANQSNWDQESKLHL